MKTYRPVWLFVCVVVALVLSACAAPVCPSNSSSPVGPVAALQPASTATQVPESTPVPAKAEYKVVGYILHWDYYKEVEGDPIIQPYQCVYSRILDMKPGGFWDNPKYTCAPYQRVTETIQIPGDMEVEDFFGWVQRIKVVQKGTISIVSVSAKPGLPSVTGTWKIGERTGTDIYAAFAPYYDTCNFFDEKFLKDNVIIAGKTWPTDSSVAVDVDKLNFSFNKTECTR